MSRFEVNETKNKCMRNVRFEWNLSLPFNGEIVASQLFETSKMLSLDLSHYMRLKDCKQAQSVFSVYTRVDGDDGVVQNRKGIRDPEACFTPTNL